jgi:hypothetical protein
MLDRTVQAFVGTATRRQGHVTPGLEMFISDNIKINVPPNVTKE